MVGQDRELCDLVIIGILFIFMFDAWDKLYGREESFPHDSRVTTSKTVLPFG